MEAEKNLPLRKFVVPENVFGEGTIELIPKYVLNFSSTKPLIVTDKGLVKIGLIHKIEQLLKKYSIEYSIFDEISPNPRDFQVMEGAEVFNNENCDLIIAVGGGSPMDCAKGIGIAVTNEKHVLNFEGVDEVEMPAPPLICVPTTAGTAADVSQFAIITDTKRNIKIAIVSKKVVPDIALIDTVTTCTMPPDLTAKTGMDALVHAIEAYVSNASSMLTDLNALEAIRLIHENLKDAYDSPFNMRARNNMMFASTLAGFAFSNAGLGIVHAMAHSLGGLSDLPHGECNALLLESAIDFNYEAAAEKYNDIAKIFGVKIMDMTNTNIKEALLEKINKLRNSVSLGYSLSTLGIKRSMIPQISKFTILDPCVATNPRVPAVYDIEACYARAL